jgi:hypothetical protein
MPTEKRIRSDYPIRELQRSRVWVARKRHECGWGGGDAVLDGAMACHGIERGDTYLRISETRLPVCLACAGVKPDDFVTITKEPRRGPVYANCP